MFKKIIIFLLACILTTSILGCAGKSSTINSGTQNKIELPRYKEQQFELSALSAPREMTEEAFLQYKNAGFNVLAFSNHDGNISSDSLYYLGSNRTIQALELCKKIGIDAYVSYGNNWNSRNIEGEDYFGDTPFSKHNYYGAYMDIIKGIRIMDEPNKEKMKQLADNTLINDFKKVYPDKKYMINLIPETAIESRNYRNYAEMLEHYGSDIMSKFDNPYICVDCYLFSDNSTVPLNILSNYNQIAQTAKKYNDKIKKTKEREKP